ncbi:cupin domain-containing protein [Streptacidiphilus rugosus]|uniref:cupin domain-containing protein n=1 Tax=Streptacidiphilus rugosus TaxID=405783 RepID=UPI00068AF1EA|nr:cupin domain-containing protein [Streptacidiphilus rugosus]
MEIFTFDRDERIVTAHGSVGLHVTRVASGAPEDTGGHPTFLAFLTVEPGGTIGTHPATGPQLLLVTAGSGWVAGADGERVPITAGQAVRWDKGELHTSGTDSGFSALALDGPHLTPFAPEGP